MLISLHSLVNLVIILLCEISSWLPILRNSVWIFLAAYTDPRISTSSTLPYKLPYQALALWDEHWIRQKTRDQEFQHNAPPS